MERSVVEAAEMLGAIAKEIIADKDAKIAELREQIRRLNDELDQAQGRLEKAHA